MMVKDTAGNEFNAASKGEIVGYDFDEQSD